MCILARHRRPYGLTQRRHRWRGRRCMTGSGGTEGRSAIQGGEWEGVPEQVDCAALRWPRVSYRTSSSAAAASATRAGNGRAGWSAPLPAHFLLDVVIVRIGSRPTAGVHGPDVFARNHSRLDRLGGSLGHAACWECRGPQRRAVLRIAGCKTSLGPLSRAPMPATPPLRRAPRQARESTTGRRLRHDGNEDRRRGCRSERK